MLLTLLRHGEVAGRAQVFRGRSDAALTQQGRLQLQQAAAKYWSMPAIDAVLSSPLQRCVEFARSYSRQRDIPLLLLDELQEIDFGEWEEMTPDEARQHDAECFQQFETATESWCAPQGESYAAFRARIRRALHAIDSFGQQHAYGHLGVVTHGGVVRAMLAEYLQLSAASAARIAVPLAACCQLWLDAQRGAQLLWLAPAELPAE